MPRFWVVDQSARVRTWRVIVLSVMLATVPRAWVSALPGYMYPIPYDSAIHEPDSYKFLLIRTGSELGGETDESDIRIAHTKLLHKAMTVVEPGGVEAFFRLLIESFDMLVHEVRRYKTEAAHANNREVFAALVMALADSRSEIGTRQRDGEGQIFWQIPEGVFATTTGAFDSVLESLESGVSDGATRNDVDRLSRDAQNLVRFARMARNTMLVYSTDRLAAAMDTVARIDREWRRYEEKSRVEFFWEHSINSWFYRADDGFLSAPPSGQLILLHPSIGYQWDFATESADRLRPAVVVDVIGYNRLSWRDGRISNWPIGISAVAVYTGAQREPWGLGLMLHVRSHLSAGMVVRLLDSDVRTAVVASFDLARLLVPEDERAQLRPAEP